MIDKRLFKIEKQNLDYHNDAFHWYIYYRTNIKRKWNRFSTICNYWPQPKKYCVSLKYQSLARYKDRLLYMSIYNGSHYFLSETLEKALIFVLKRLKRKKFKDKYIPQLEDLIEELMLKEL